MVYINVMFFFLIMRYAFNQIGHERLGKADNAYLMVSSLILMLLTGLRSKYVGSDTMSYINFFKSTRKLDLEFVLSEKYGRFEIGYKIFTKLIGYITSSEVVFFLIIGVFFAICLYKFINENSENKFLSVLLYYTVGMFSFQMTASRQAVAMAFVLISFKYIKERKIWKFLLFAYLASLFHKSALAIIPMYFLANVKMNFKNFFSFIVVGGIMCVYSSAVVNIANKILGYDNDIGGFEGGAIFVVLMYIITIIVSYIYMDGLEKSEKNNVFFFNMTFVSLIIYILRYFMTLAERVSFYYQFAFIILLPNVIESIPDKKTRNVIRTCAVVLACLLFMYRCIGKGNTNMIYSFFWQR